MSETKNTMEEVVEQMKGMFETLKEFRADVSSRLGVLEEGTAKLDEIDTQLAAMETKIAEREKEIKRRPGTMGADQGDFGPDGFSIVRALMDKGSPDMHWAAEYTDKVRGGASGALETRASSQSTDSEGGFLIPEEMLPGFIEQARARVVVWDPALLTIHSGLRGSPVTIPTETGSTTVAWGGENVAPSDSDVTLSQLSFTPNRLSGWTQVSRRLDFMAPNIESIVQRNLGRTVGLELDRVLLRGSGTNSEPEGVANTSGILATELATDGALFTMDAAMQQVQSLEAANTFGGNMAFIGHPFAFHTMRTERIPQFDAGATDPGSYVMLPMNDATLEGMLGFGFRKTTQIPVNLTKGASSNLTEVYFGNWEDLHLGLWQDLEFRLSEHATDGTTHAFLADMVFILVNLTADVEIARAASFNLVNDAAATNPVS